MGLSELDDYCIHQCARVIREPATDDRNAYDRYFANGFARDGRYYFAVSLGRYPNRGIMDAAVTFQTNGVHHSFFASRRDPEEPTAMRLGEFELRIEKPMRVMSVRLERNDSGLSCELRWLARSAPIQETRSTTSSAGKVTEDITRWTQFGCWEGWFEIDGVRTEVIAEHCPGVKDRSWGIRAYGSGDDASQRSSQQLFWNWIPLSFGDFAIHSLRLEDAGGSARLEESFVLPLYASEGAVPLREDRIERIGRWTHDYEVSAATRRITGGSIRLGGTSDAPRQRTIALGTPLLTAWTYAIGYNHVEWPHGAWHGELATGHERWRVSEVDRSNPAFALMHHVVPVTCDGTPGIGFIEQCILGPYPRYGLSG